MQGQLELGDTVLRVEKNERIVRKYDVCLGTSECEWFLDCLERTSSDR